MSKKNVAELRAENRILRQTNTGLAYASVANNFIKWGAVVLIAYFMYLSIDSLAGRETVADVVMLKK